MGWLFKKGVKPGSQGQDRRNTNRSENNPNPFKRIQRNLFDVDTSNTTYQSLRQKGVEKSANDDRVTTQIKKKDFPHYMFNQIQKALIEDYKQSGLEGVNDIYRAKALPIRGFNK